jgi:hypothetical protein
MSPHSPDDLARALVAVEHASQVVEAKTRKASEAGTSRAFELGLVVEAAMRETARLAQRERAFAVAVPAAAGRLRILADLAAVSFAKVVVDGTARMMLGHINETTDQ